MSGEPAPTAQQAAASVRLSAGWEIYGQRLRRYEVYFDGGHVETVRGPIVLEGVGLRLFRPTAGKMGVGFQATTDLSPPGLREAAEVAETTARTAVFPAAQVELPSHAPRIAPSAEACSVPLWERPEETVEGYVHELLAPFAALSDVRVSFGSIKATLAETSIVNSEGLSTSFVATDAELEIAVKAFGGPEGRAPGEYWLTREFRQLDPAPIRAEAERWAERARDVRRAKAPPSGTIPVVLPPALLNEILPESFAVRFSGGGRLRQMTFDAGTAIAAGAVTVHNDTTVPWSVGASPLDDEGTAAGAVRLISAGKADELLYDALHGAAFDRRSNGAAGRASMFGRVEWHRFTRRPAPAIGTLVVSKGDVRTDAELIEGVEEGVWVDQLGWPNPDPYAGTFGGELRIGYRIHHGKLAEPVRGGTVGGFVFAPAGTASLLGGVRRLGSRTELVGRTLAPALLVDGLSVASPE